MTVLKRLWQYQKERFPVFKHGILIASFSFCAVCLSSVLRSDSAWPSFQVSLTAFICLFCFFLQLRIADEFKDQENDLQYRPNRPVPRGLVSLNELKYLGFVSALVQILLSYFLYPPLIFILILVWVYIALMSAEFFVPTWLQQRPMIYLLTHMLVMPMIDLFATSCDWLRFGLLPPSDLMWFLAVSFFNGIVIEIGRKTWAPEQERPGVESYSADWGIKRAILAWSSAMILSILCAYKLFPKSILLLLIAALLVYFGIRFIANPSVKKSKYLESISGLWVAGFYFTLGGYNLWSQI